MLKPGKQEEKSVMLKIKLLAIWKNYSYESSLLWGICLSVILILFSSRNQSRTVVIEISKNFLGPALSFIKQHRPWKNVSALTYMLIMVHFSCCILPSYGSYMEYREMSCGGLWRSTKSQLSTLPSLRICISVTSRKSTK